MISSRRLVFDTCNSYIYDFRVHFFPHILSAGCMRLPFPVRGRTNEKHVLSIQHLQIYPREGRFSEENVNKSKKRDLVPCMYYSSDIAPYASAKASISILNRDGNKNLCCIRAVESSENLMQRNLLIQLFGLIHLKIVSWQLR